ncbi:MAG: EAL domain-containing protein [Christensenellales bacterium]|jgi:diguanylate cyclase (GGDEF)-like protein
MPDRLSPLERQVYDLIDRYTLDFSEELTLESPEDFFYLSDTETYEIYLISVVNPGQMNEAWKHYQGRKCYEVLQGRSTPCPFCTNHQLAQDRYLVWEYRNPILQRDYILKDKLVNWKGKQVRMEVVIDVNDPRRISRVLRDNIECQNILIGCIQSLVYGRSLGSAVEEFLPIVCGFYQAQLGYVHCFEQPHQPYQLYTWRAEGAQDCHAPLCPKPSPELIQALMGPLAPGRQTVIKDAKAIRQSDPEGYAFLSERGIDSYCITPLYADQELAGVLCLYNVRAHWTDLSLLNTLGTYVAGVLQRERLQQENLDVLYGDSVTGYNSFVWFKQQVADILAQRQGSRYALWYSDLKNFKYINDVFGYDLGNRVLKYWADLIAADTREGEVFARVSADNFTRLVRYETVQELAPRFERAARLLADCPETRARKFPLELVTGVYLIEPGDNLSLAEMMNRANIAQKSVKSQRGSQIAIYTESMRQRVLNDLRLETQMRDAIRAQEFVLYLQPQVSALPQPPGAPARAEALVRWQRDGKIIAMPGEFIGLFERNGTIVDLDLYVFKQACAYLKQLDRDRADDLRLAVNVSRISMLQPNFIENYCRVRDAYGIAPGRLELEFTESIAVENYEQFRQTVLALKQMGFLCAMDDFGTGQSSLNVLQSLPLDVLKLDKRFFDFGQEPERGRAVVHSVLKMAKELNMDTVAEGIEEMAQVTMLRQMGCDYIQGYVFAKPMPAADYRQALMEGRYR